MNFPSFNAVLVDYDEDLFAPQGWESGLLERHGIAWGAAPASIARPKLPWRRRDRRTSS